MFDILVVYWVRYEFAPGRGQIHAHLLAIPHDHSPYTTAYNLSQSEDGESKRAMFLADWAQQQFGLTASIDKEIASDDNTTSQTTIRFTDLGNDDDVIYRDGQCLLKEVEMHECSRFCMREINKKQ